MLHAVLNLTGSSSDKVNTISGLFRMCCADGCLNQHIINTLAEAMSEEEFAIITGMSNENSIQIESLPTEWSSNSRMVSELDFSDCVVKSTTETTALTCVALKRG